MRNALNKLKEKTGEQEKQLEEFEAGRRRGERARVATLTQSKRAMTEARRGQLEDRYDSDRIRRQNVASTKIIADMPIGRRMKDEDVEFLLVAETFGDVHPEGRQGNNATQGINRTAHLLRLEKGKWMMDDGFDTD
ncbi:MAG: hypothetical protein ACE5KM_19650 [Planctomycetaceae bacterium]